MDHTPNMQNVFVAVNRQIERRVARHEEEHHGLPPRRTEPITAVPYAEWHLDDAQTCRAIEMQIEGASLEEIAMALDVPGLVIERAMHDYKPPYRDWLHRRAQ